jgi:peptidoglycan/LPS O-acetylase OafA/YrhL
MEQLDGLRAIAVAFVLVDHWVGNSYHLGIDWGRLGVHLFYVLSGFLITSILLEVREVSGKSKWFGARQFYIRRFLRIFPLFYATLLVTYIVGIPIIRQTIWWHVAYLSNAYVSTLGFWPNYISHFWSLGVEEQFYLTWAWLILFLPHRWLLRVLLAFIYSAPLFRLGGYLFTANPISVYVLPVSSFDSLGVGALLAFLSRYKNTKPFSIEQFARASAWIGGTVLLLLELLRHFIGGSPLMSALQIGLKGTALAFIYGWIVWRASMGFRGRVGMLLQWRPVAYLGKISYGIYMFNPFMFSLLSWCLSCIGLVSLMGVSVIRLALLFLLTVGLAAVSWKYFEGPVNALRHYVRYDV